jgi:imidazolonepropionase-like amidohydrolase/Tol biopolymer transport system component
MWFRPRLAAALLASLCASRAVAVHVVADIDQTGNGTASDADFRIHEEGDTLPLKPVRLLKWDEREGTWVSLDVAPDGKTIVFELLGDLYTMPIAGGEAKCIVCGLPFDSQPVYSPDGAELAFVSDRDGNENLWISNADGSGPRQISTMEDNSVFISPEWAPDGKSIYISRYKPDMNAFELWRYSASGADHEPLEQVTHAKRSPDTPKELRYNALGAAVSPDGRYLYYETKTGLGFDDDVNFPLWHIVRRDLKTGEEQAFISAEGSAFRPRVSPDGKLLVYAERYQGKTELRVRNLVTDEDRLLAYPIQRDDQEGIGSRDLLPRYAFAPDSRSLVTNYGGKIYRIDVATGKQSEVPFVAHVKLPVGPYMRPELTHDTGPVRARLIQTPSENPDGTRIVFSALAKIYIAGIGADGKSSVPARLTESALPEFEPSWSPDGQWIVYVIWTPEAGGEVWRARADGSGQPEKISPYPDYYAYPVFAPDGKSVFVLRVAEYDQVHKIADFPPYQADLIEIPLEHPGAAANVKVITSGMLRSGAQFAGDAGAVYLNFSDGLYRVPLDGTKPGRVLHVVGPTYYFMEGTAPADGVKISPDGRWALAQITQQLYLIRIPDGIENTTSELSVELAKPAPVETRLTAVGADFFGWADSGKTITWALGSTFFREKLADVKLGSSEPPAGTDMERAGVAHIRIAVEVPRDTPSGAIVLRGGTAITMQSNAAGDDGIIRDADVVIVNDSIAAVGKRGTVPIPKGAKILDETGHFIVPGFIDVHIHWGSIRRGVLDTECWEFQAALAYGVTATLDPSSLSIDTFAYQDMIDAGLMIGSRIYTTGPALFSFNHIDTEEQALNNIRRNPEFYRTRDLKEYRTGNRAQRELVVEASRTLSLVTTTEGAMDMKLDMTQIQDGFSGNEHAYSAVPIADDIVQLFSRTGVSYTPTLQISNGGMWGQTYFFSRESPYADKKLRHFTPQFFLARKMERLHWGLPQEYSFPQVAEGAARIQRNGGLVAVGSHGELPGLGYHFEMQALAMGGMTPEEVLWAATMGSAKTIGRDGELGSLTAGKYADLVVLDKDPTRDIHNTLSIDSVMKNGRLYEGSTLDEIWPRHRAQPVTWWQREDQTVTAH